MFSLMIFYLLSACGMFVGFFFHALRDSERKFHGEGGGGGRLKQTCPTCGRCGYFLELYTVPKLLCG